MDNFHYQCHYCGKHYTPKRRYKQLFCSSSCRVNAFNKSRKKALGTPATNLKNDPKNPIQVDKMSWAGVGNAVVGTLATNTVTNIFTKEENRPATKKDVREIIAALKQRYFIIKNLKPNTDGSLSYFDIQTSTIIYFKPNNKATYGSL
jgi:hypothetical protein